jgi:hypothetical protein
MLFAFAFRRSRSSSHLKFNAFNASYFAMISWTSTSTFLVVAFFCTNSALSRTNLKSIAAFHASALFVSPDAFNAGASLVALARVASVARCAGRPGVQRRATTLAASGEDEDEDDVVRVRAAAAATTRRCMADLTNVLCIARVRRDVDRRRARCGVARRTSYGGDVEPSGFFRFFLSLLHNTRRAGKQ